MGSDVIDVNGGGGGFGWWWFSSGNGGGGDGVMDAHKLFDRMPKRGMQCNRWMFIRETCGLYFFLQK